MKNAITSFFSLKDLLYIYELFLVVTDPDEHSALIHVAPPSLYRVGEKEVQLLDYAHFPPMDTPAFQGPLCSQQLAQYLFTVMFLASKVASLPAAALNEQWCQFEFVCKAITAYQDYIVVVPQGCHHTFTADIWPVGSGEMNSIIRLLAAWCEAAPSVVMCNDQLQEKELIGLMKKRGWSLAIDPAHIIGEFG